MMSRHVEVLMNQSSLKLIYVFGDGDKIREKVERLLFLNELSALKEFSRKLTDAVEQMQKIAERTMEADVIIAGGDDFLFSTSNANYRREHIESLSLIFEQLTGCTISFGVGPTMEIAYLNLRRAKVLDAVRIMEIRDE